MQDRMTRETAPQNLRGLKALVIGLGVLLVLGTLLVIGVVVERLVTSAGPGQAASNASPAGGPFMTALPGGQDSAVAGVASARGAVAIWLRNAAGGKVVFIDPRSGHILGTASPKP